jgi:hypothetical protein
MAKHRRNTLLTRLVPNNFVSLCSLILFAVAALTPAWGQEQTKQVEYQGGPGKKMMPATKVEFKPGPFGPDGKVHQVVPDAKARRFPNEVETPEEHEAGLRAAAGLTVPTSKQPSNALSAQQLSLLHWNPNQLDPAKNPILGGELFKSAEEKNPFKSDLAKGFKNNSSTPIKGKDFAGFGDTGWFPPDGGIAAGPYHVVEVVNSSINVYDKNGNLLSSQSLNNFFANLGTPGSDFLYDPSIYYDQLTSRFWLLATSQNTSPQRSNYLLAVSITSDVTDGFYIYAFDATVDGGSATNNWCDYPHLGMDADAIYMSCNMFQFGGGFQYAKVRVMVTSEFTGGACCSWWDFYNLKEGFLNTSTSFTVRPALERWVGYGFGDFWVDAEGGGGNGSTLKVWQLTNATECCNGGSGPTLNGNEQGVGSYDSPPAAAQPNGVTGLDTGGTRVLFATYQFGHLSVGQTISCNQGGTTDACAGFTEMDVSSYPTMSNVNDWYYSQPAGEDVYYPFVDQNVNSDKTMVYTRSDGSSTYPGAYYVGIPNSSTCTGCTDGEVAMAYGQANYSVIDGSGRNRWGDYQGASNDTDFLGIWVTGEYVSSSNAWAKEIDPSYNSYYPIDSPSPSTVPFGNQAIYSSAATQYVTFTNAGNATMYTNNTQITGDTDFYITYDGCRYVTLYQGASCQEGVSFYPNSIGAGTGYIIVNDNTSATYGYSTLTGTGVKAGTTTSLGSSLNPSTYHQTVTFTAHVAASTAGTPGGSVVFYDGSTVLGTVALSGGVAHLSTSTLQAGGHTITAQYAGSSIYLTSSTAIGQTVNKASTSTALVSSKNPSSFGQSVTFKGTVSSGEGTPLSGGITFHDGTIALATVPTVSGVATYTTSALTGGTHSITGTYQGSNNYDKSTSSLVSQVVHKVGSTTTVTASVNPSAYHQSVTFTAKVTSAVGIPSGTVTFKNGTVILATATLNASGVATHTMSSLTVGAHSITVAYAGDTNHVASASTGLAHTVNKASTKTAVTSSKNPSTHGTAVTFTATITPAFGGTATGTVTFKNGTTALGTGAVNASNKATFTTSTLAVGTHSITASYPGSADFTASGSAVLKQVVQ